MIVVTPDVSPHTIPVAIPTVATAEVLLLQVPPGVASVSVTQAPLHTVDGPAIGACANEIIEMKRAMIVS